MHIKNIVFDTDSPNCLYCNNDCEVSSTGMSNLITDTYYCNLCDESFIFFYKDDSLVTFEFTCNIYSVLIDPNTNIFKLSPNLSSIDHNDNINVTKLLKNISIHEFMVDFSNKQKLFEKLHTYAIFS